MSKKTDTEIVYCVECKNRRFDPPNAAQRLREHYAQEHGSRQ